MNQAERDQHGPMTFVNRGGKNAAGTVEEIESRHRLAEGLKVRQDRLSRNGDHDAERRPAIGPAGRDRKGPAIRSSRV
ncbi:hypothetical protein MesoLjLc_21970 [Mesorhizobium sp. L-8-10]|nr:hypothetical protein MesoLjLb_22390 [Mesorhizobium sp. L-8-3]BCH30267.1 hypothetical protein MesoLjLc_21970 [Mesorhizobium sp. L-8-10]